jgi:hypothetical protein
LSEGKRKQDAQQFPVIDTVAHDDDEPQLPVAKPLTNSTIRGLRVEQRDACFKLPLREVLCPLVSSRRRPYYLINA